ncbi:MAG: N-6 DNA methylase [Candidatus Saccharibacteria bacterium]|nr:N-6 DNA methylase [Candidatus Saccharibacteria bacterium]
MKDNILASKQASKQADTLTLSKNPAKTLPGDIASGSLRLSKKSAKPEKLIKSKKRVKEFGEVFTPEFIVKQMCDLCEPDLSRIDGKVFEPTCGNGNFLVEILRRKLTNITFKNQKQFEFEIILALSNVYAVDIQPDNVAEARKRLHHIVLDFTKDRRSSAAFLLHIEYILTKTILVGNTLAGKAKLIFYDFKPHYDDFSFEISHYSLKDIEEKFAKTRKAHVGNIKEVIQRAESPPEKAKAKRRKKVPDPQNATKTISNQARQTTLFKEDV